MQTKKMTQAFLHKPGKFRKKVLTAQVIPRDGIWVAYLKKEKGEWL